MPTCANTYLALAMSSPPDLSKIPSIAAPTASISFSFDPMQNRDNSFSNLPKYDIDLSTTPSLSNTTLSETLTSNTYTLTSIKFIAPTFQTYNPVNSNSIRGELVYYFRGTSKKIAGYYVVVPVYYNSRGYSITQRAIIRQLFPLSLEYVQYPYCDAEKNKYYVIYLYNGIHLNIELQTTIDRNINFSSIPWSSGNSLFTFYKNIAPATTPPLNTTKQFMCTDLNTSKDIEGKYVVVDPSNGKRLNNVLTEVNAAQAASLNLNGMSLIEKILLYVLITLGSILGILFIYYLLRWSVGDLKLKDVYDAINKKSDIQPTTGVSRGAESIGTATVEGAKAVGRAAVATGKAVGKAAVATGKAVGIAAVATGKGVATAGEYVTRPVRPYLAAAARGTASGLTKIAGPAPT